MTPRTLGCPTSFEELHLLSEGDRFDHERYHHERYPLHYLSLSEDHHDAASIPMLGDPTLRFDDERSPLGRIEMPRSGGTRPLPRSTLRWRSLHPLPLSSKKERG